MGEETKAVIAVLAGAAVFVICFIKLFLMGRPRKEKLYERLKAGGWRASAVCVDRKRKFGNSESSGSFKNDTMIVTYEYRIGGSSYRKKLRFQSPGRVSVDYPYQIEIYYDPKKPSKGVCKEEIPWEKNKGLGCFGTMVFTLLTIGVIYNLLTFALK